MAILPSPIVSSFDHQGFRTISSGRRAVGILRAVPHLPHGHRAHFVATEQQRSSPSQLWQNESSHVDRQQLSLQSGSSRPTPLLALSSTTTTAAAMTTDASIPTAFARVVVGAALALSTVYALLSSPASSVAGAAFTSTTSPSSTPLDSDPRRTSPTTSASPTTISSPTTIRSPSFPGTAATATATTTTSTTDAANIATINAAAFTTINSLPILSTADQFDRFVIATNRAGYLAIVLFHAPWCSASQKMQLELQRLSYLFTGRRVIFARVDCSIKQGVKPGAPLGQVPSPGFKLQRCDLTQLHRIHKTPTMRMYYNNACVDEIVGFRPVDFRQAASDLTFKYNL